MFNQSTLQKKMVHGAIGDCNKQFTKYMLPTAAITIRRCKVSSPALICMLLLAVTAVGSNVIKHAYILLFLDPLT